MRNIRWRIFAFKPFTPRATRIIALHAFHRKLNVRTGLNFSIMPWYCSSPLVEDWRWIEGSDWYERAQEEEHGAEEENICVLTVQWMNERRSGGIINKLWIVVACKKRFLYNKPTQLYTLETGSLFQVCRFTWLDRTDGVSNVMFAFRV